MDKDPIRADSELDGMDIDRAVERYGNMVYRLALSRLGKCEDAEDVTQEVFMRLFQNKAKFESEEHRKAWLLRVAINCSINLRTSSYRRHHAELSDELAAVTPDPKAEVYAEDQAIALLRQLPVKYRQVLHLFYYEELSVAEIARVMDSREGTVKSLLHRGRQKLRLLWNEREAII